MQRIGRIVAATAVGGALALGTVGPAYAGTSVSDAWCKGRSWWDPRWPDCYASGTFDDNGEHFSLQDTEADGHSAVMKIWVNGVRQADLWNNFGSGTTQYRDFSLAEGTPISFQLCYGEYGSRTILKCKDATSRGTA